MVVISPDRQSERDTANRRANPVNEIRAGLPRATLRRGLLQEARATLEEFLRVAECDIAVFPGTRLKDWEPYWYSPCEYHDQKDFDHLFDALRKAGRQNESRVHQRRDFNVGRFCLQADLPRDRPERPLCPRNRTPAWAVRVSG
jgi:hypothetical protein